ncbi:MAG TPA: DUF3048 domain-containing protein [Candidatus Limnocylindrales bacterium]|nr:DUF3048 domain-containing protein [Candidatus Limnocylindrales bacterium]
MPLTPPQRLGRALRDPKQRWAVIGSLLAVLGVLVLAVLAVLGSQPSRSADVTLPPTFEPSPSASATASPTASTAAASASPPATPAPIYEGLSGVATTAELAHRYPIAVMLDDSPAARPQAGLASASIVWQAPAEGGIPRYMAVYQSGTAPLIGPVRSARLYFVRWAAEWRAVYLHAGGPPPLKAFLRGRQTLVINADGKRTFRVGWRAAPHNLYTTGERMLEWARANGGTDDRLGYDPAAPGALQPFRDAAPLGERGPDAGRISLTYTSERVDYRYDRATNTWLRFVDGREQRDAETRQVRGFGTRTDGPRIAPTTVVVMVVPIRRSSSIEGPALGRLEADSIGSGKAWLFVEGRVVAATWKKADERARTRFVDAAGAEIVLPRGQLFVQVVPRRSAFDYDLEE